MVTNVKFNIPHRICIWNVVSLAKCSFNEVFERVHLKYVLQILREERKYIFFIYSFVFIYSRIILHDKKKKHMECKP